MLLLTHVVLSFLNNREEHILRKIDQVVIEAKQKLAKGDKKGMHTTTRI
jgi:hypothetical protein